MLAKKPEERFDRFEDLVDALDKVFADDEHASILALLDGVEKEEPTPVEKQRVPAWLINGAVVLCAIAVVGAAVYGSKQAATTRPQRAAVREEVPVEVAPWKRDPVFE